MAITNEDTGSSVLDGAFYNKDEYYLVATASGRVVFTAGSLRLYLESDLTGRNLNDFMPDEQVAGLVAAAYEGNGCDLECDIYSRHFRAEMEPYEGHMMLSLFPVSPSGQLFMQKRAAQFVCREINESLNLMFAALDSLKGFVPEGNGSLALLRKQMFQMVRLSKNMLDTAYYESGELRVSLIERDICEFCQDLFERLQEIFERIGLESELSLPDHPVVCRFDLEKIGRALLHLVSNAIQGSARGGKIRLSLADRGDSVAISVADRGRGITQSQMGALFSKAVEGKPERGDSLGGAGFGMMLVKAFTEMHGGSFVISGAEGSGTSACINLPKNLERDLAPLNETRPEYAGGFDYVLLELSTALAKEFYSL